MTKNYLTFASLLAVSVLVACAQPGEEGASSSAENLTAAGEQKAWQCDGSDAGMTISVKVALNTTTNVLSLDVTSTDAAGRTRVGKKTAIATVTSGNFFADPISGMSVDGASTHYSFEFANDLQIANDGSAQLRVQDSSPIGCRTL